MASTVPIWTNCPVSTLRVLISAVARGPHLGASLGEPRDLERGLGRGGFGRQALGFEAGAGELFDGDELLARQRLAPRQVGLGPFPVGHRLAVRGVGLGRLEAVAVGVDARQDRPGVTRSPASKRTSWTAPLTSAVICPSSAGSSAPSASTR